MIIIQRNGRDDELEMILDDQIAWRVSTALKKSLIQECKKHLKIFDGDEHDPIARWVIDEIIEELKKKRKDQK